MSIFPTVISHPSCTGFFRKSLEHSYEPSEAYETLLGSLCELIRSMRRGKVLSIDNSGGLAGIVFCNYPYDSSHIAEAREKIGNKNVVCVDL